MKSILFVHQSADLYGSDRMLLTLVAGLDRRKFSPIVLIPRNGPLADALRRCGVTTVVRPVATVSRASLKPRATLKLPFQIATSICAIDDALDGRSVDIVHSNTLAAISGAIWARARGKALVWHVHEMITHPLIAKYAFPWFLDLAANTVVCNSSSARDLLVGVRPSLSLKTITILNGLDRPAGSTVARAPARSALGIGPTDVMVLLVGRINRMKGQRLLLEAARTKELRDNKRIHYVLVGSAASGQQHFVTDLRKLISESGISDRIHLLDFHSNIWPFWDACDIAVVPSIEPESFGTVAVEAMLARRPVVAAAHGGILDIVESGKTGLLIPPNDPGRLAAAVAKLAGDEATRHAMGKAGHERAVANFSIAAYVRNFVELYESLV
jgi:glycosyltransferase involved in cell wall biosynthesis